MVDATVVIAILLSAGAVAWVVWPLLTRAPAPLLVDDDRLADLLTRKDAVMAAIRDLEFDYGVGKLDAADYALYDGRLRRQAVGLIQQIEQIAPAGAGMDAAMENEIRRRRKVADGGREVPAAAPSRPAAAATPMATQVAAGAGNGAGKGVPAAAGRQYCTNCGHPLEPQHRFCANCGTPAAALAESSPAPAAVAAE